MEYQIENKPEIAHEYENGRTWWKFIDNTVFANQNEQNK
jgi:hypothetical protein